MSQLANDLFIHNALRALLTWRLLTPCVGVGWSKMSHVYVYDKIWTIDGK